MKKKILLLMGVFSIGILLHAQVGINTKTPLTPFHIDPKGDTNATGTSGTADDVVVSTTGMVGIGTITPSAQLEVNGKFRLDDGTQADGLVLTSDANGYASWQKAKSQLRLNMGNLPIVDGDTDPRALRIPLTAAYNSAGTTEKLYYTGGFFTLDPGKQLIQVCFYSGLFGNFVGSVPTSWYGVSYTLSTSPTSVIPPSYLSSGGRRISHFSNMPNVSICTTGYWLVENKGSAPQNIYIWVSLFYDPAIQPMLGANLCLYAPGANYWVENVLVTYPIDESL